MPHLHALTRRRVRQLFLGDLSPAGHRALFAELGRCGSCAQLYARHHAAEAALCGQAEGPTPFSIERMERFILDTVARKPALGLARWRWAPFAAAAMAVVLLLVLWPKATPPERVFLAANDRLEEVLVARGGATARPTVGVRLFRVSPGGRVDEAREASLSLDDLVSYTYTDVRGGAQHLALFGVQEGGALRWYYPGDDGVASVPIRGDVVDEPLGDGFRLAVRHAPGWLRVSAVFSSEPIDRRVLEQAVRAASARPGALRDLSPLDLPAGALEHTFLVEIGARR